MAAPADRAALTAVARALEVHQFVPALLPGDAVGNHVVATRRELAAEGVAASTWAGAIHPQLVREARSWNRFERSRPARGRRRVLLYQAASFSGGLADRLGRRDEPTVISYHNLTPPSYFAPYDGIAARELALAADELRRLAARTRVAIAASEFNAADLRGLGLERVHVVPPYLGRTIAASPDATILRALTGTHRGVDMVFVGRLTPNKGHAHLVRLLAVLRAGIDPHARLFLVGSPGPRLYVQWLERLIDRVAPDGVVLTGPVSEAGLAAHYRNADVFVCLSSHEGFGIPLVEAMRADVPVLAYDAGAVAETLGGAGVLVQTRRPTILAELVDRIARDPDLRAGLCRRQRERAAELEAFPRCRALLTALAEAAA